MPIYEYRCEQDGSVIELLRPMADADKPVEDPDGQGRVFRRQHSTFAPGGSAADQGRSVSLAGRGGGCPCGKPHGSCGSMG
jgi:putative FmdB family regulatory protein